MPKIAYLSYSFIFEPSKTWAHVSQFEETFGKYLQDHGLEGEFVDNISPSGAKIMYIRPKERPQQMGPGNARTAQILNKIAHSRRDDENAG